MIDLARILDPALPSVTQWRQSRGNFCRRKLKWAGSSSCTNHMFRRISRGKISNKTSKIYSQKKSCEANPTGPQRFTTIPSPNVENCCWCFDWTVLCGLRHSKCICTPEDGQLGRNM
jgi:hypothetical protein